MPDLIRLAVLLTFSTAAFESMADDARRDPMRPDNLVISRSVQIRTTYTVSAIFQADGQRVAIVNDRPVRAGDLVGSARVLAIAEDTVELATASGRQTVSLKTRKEQQ